MIKFLSHYGREMLRVILKKVISVGALVAHLLEHIPCIKAESLPQQPVFDSSPVPLLHVIPSLSPVFPVSLQLSLSE